MMISDDNQVLALFESNDESGRKRSRSDDDDDDDGDEDEKEPTDSQRKARAGRNALSKRGKDKDGKGTNQQDSPPSSLDFSFRMKSRETHEGVISATTEKGSLWFDGPDNTAFTGRAKGLDLSVSNVFFRARKMWDTPAESSDLGQLFVSCL